MRCSIPLQEGGSALPSVLITDRSQGPGGDAETVRVNRTNSEDYIWKGWNLGRAAAAAWTVVAQTYSRRGRDDGLCSRCSLSHQSIAVLARWMAPSQPG